MNRTISSGKAWRVLPPALLLSASLVCGGVQAVSATTAGSVTEATQDIRIVDILPLNSTTVEVIFSNQQRLTLDFYGNHIFRLFQDPMGGILRDPVAGPLPSRTRIAGRMAAWLRPTLSIGPRPDMASCGIPLPRVNMTSDASGRDSSR